MSDTPQTDPSHWTAEYLAQYHGRPVVITTILFIVLNTVFAVLRACSRYVQKINWGWDDPLIFLSWLLNIGLCTCLLLSNHYGASRHIEYLSLHPELMAKRGIIDLYVEGAIFSLATAPPRLAILIVYLKIFLDRFSRVSCWVLGSMITGLSIANFFVILFSCTPRAKLWDPSIVGGSCLNVEAHTVWGYFPNWVFDIFILILPLPVIRRLHTPLRLKLGIAATFAVGSIGMVCAIIRWTAFFTDKFLGGDQSWADNPLTIWLLVEPSAYLISACLLTLRPLLRHLSNTRAATSMYNWLLQSRISRMYASSSKPQSPQSSCGKCDNNASGSHSGHTGVSPNQSKQDLIAPFRNVTTVNYSTDAERAEAIEMNTMTEGVISVRKDVYLSSA